MSPLFETQIEIILFLVTLVVGLIVIIITILKLKPKQYIPPEIISTLFTAKHGKGDTVFYAKIENSELYICIHNNKVFFSKTIPSILDPVWSNIPPPPP